MRDETTMSDDPVRHVGCRLSVNDTKHYERRINENLVRVDLTLPEDNIDVCVTRLEFLQHSLERPKGV